MTSEHYIVCWIGKLFKGLLILLMTHTTKRLHFQEIVNGFRYNQMLTRKKLTTSKYSSHVTLQQGNLNFLSFRLHYCTVV